MTTPNTSFEGKLPPVPSLVPTEKPKVNTNFHPLPTVTNRSLPNHSTLLPLATNPYCQTAGITLVQLARVLKEKIRNKANSLVRCIQTKATSQSTTNLQPLSTRTSTTQSAFHIFDPTGKKQTLEHLLKGSDQAIWKRSASNEFGRLAQGNAFGVKGTDTIKFISKADLPQNAKTTYASFVCDIRPLKKKMHRVRMVVGGDKLLPSCISP